MEYIFHETQEGALCAQHCLNSLLQGDYYSAVDLANIAHELDQMEQNFMSAEGRSNDKRVMESTNYDDTGYFSIQVLQKALESWNLELIPYNSQNMVARMAREQPTSQQAYICNFRNHWYTIRRIGNYWFNLNSLLTQPELISDTYLNILLAQLINDGYSIFIVYGDLLKSQADTFLSEIKLDTKAILSQQASRKKPRMNEEDEDDEHGRDLGFDQDLKRAIKMSLIENDMDLDRFSGSGLYPSLAYESSSNQATSGMSSSSSQRIEEVDEEAELKRAIEMSMENKQATSTEVSQVGSMSEKVDMDEVRRKRLEYLERSQKSPQ